MSKKTKISKGLIKIGFRPEELDDMVRICNAAKEFYEERSSKESYEKAEIWERNFKLFKRTKIERKEKEEASEGDEDIREIMNDND